MDITRALVFVAVFFAFFAPKIGSLDTSPVSAIACLVLLAHQRRIHASREYLVSLFLVISLLAYSIIAALANGSSDTYAMMRLCRTLISTAALGLAFYNSDVKPGTLINIVLVVLLLNSAAILAQILAPSTQPLFAGLYGFNKGAIRTLRAFGLTAGYDTAGYLCVAGAILSTLKILKGNRVLPYLLTLSAFTVSALFTSRSSMTLNLLVMASVCLAFIFKGRLGLKVVGLSYLGAGFVLVTTYMLPLLLSTFMVSELQVAAAKSDVDYTDNFSRTDISQWQNTMWIVPDGFWQTVFGTGADVPESDMGYVKIIYMSGLVGLVLTFLFYGYLLWKALVLKRRIPPGTMGEESTDTRILAMMLIAFLMAMFVVNVKNLYFFTRAYHEMTVILFFMTANWVKRVARPW